MMAMLPPPPTKPITQLCSVVLVGEGKKEYAKPHTKGRGVGYGKEDRAYDCGCNSGSPLRDDVGSLRKITHPTLEQVSTVTN